MSRSAYVAQITPEYLSRSIVINITENIDSMQFNLTDEQKNFYLIVVLNQHESK